MASFLLSLAPFPFAIEQLLLRQEKRKENFHSLEILLPWRWINCTSALRKRGCLTITHWCFIHLKSHCSKCSSLNSLDNIYPKFSNDDPTKKQTSAFLAQFQNGCYVIACVFFSSLPCQKSQRDCCYCMAPSNCRHRHPQSSSVASPSSLFSPSFSSSPWLSRRPFLDHLFAVFFSLNSIDLERLRQFPLFIAKANGSFTNTAPNHLDELSTKLNENTTTQTIKPNSWERHTMVTFYVSTTLPLAESQNNT